MFGALELPCGKSSVLEWFVRSHLNILPFQIPYSTMSNQETVQYIKKSRLEKPEACPDEVYQIMVATWQSIPEERPSFKELHSQLEAIFQRIKNPMTVYTPITTVPTGYYDPIPVIQ
jgi:hypothetical protein